MFAQPLRQRLSGHGPTVARLSRLIDQDRQPAHLVSGERVMRVNGLDLRCDLSAARGCVQVGRLLFVSGEQAFEAFDRAVGLLSHADDSAR